MAEDERDAAGSLLHSSAVIICTFLRYHLYKFPLVPMSITSPDSTSDPWGQQYTSVSAHDDPLPNMRNLTVPKSTHVPDDWDNDDEEEEADSQKIWETANTKSPMPQLVISRSSTSATVISPPPPTVIQAPLRILKRPTSTTTPSNTSSASPSPVPQTLAEREAKYQEARERIFGSFKPSEQDGPKTNTPPPKPVLNMIRNPTGTDTNTPGPNQNPPQGSGGKRGRRPPKP